MLGSHTYSFTIPSNVNQHATCPNRISSGSEELSTTAGWQLVCIVVHPVSAMHTKSSMDANWRQNWRCQTTRQIDYDWQTNRASPRQTEEFSTAGRPAAALCTMQWTLMLHESEKVICKTRTINSIGQRDRSGWESWFWIRSVNPSFGCSTCHMSRIAWRASSHSGAAACHRMRKFMQLFRLTIRNWLMENCSNQRGAIKWNIVKFYFALLVPMPSSLVSPIKWELELIIPFVPDYDGDDDYDRQ